MSAQLAAIREFSDNFIDLLVDGGPERQSSTIFEANGNLEHRQILRDAIQRLTDLLSGVEQAELPVTHRFGGGTYIREMLIPKHTFVVGKRHKTEHFNIVASGDVSFFTEEGIYRVHGPCTFVTGPGIRKALFTREDTVWMTVHHTPESDIEKIEEDLIYPEGMGELP